MIETEVLSSVYPAQSRFLSRFREAAKVTRHSGQRLGSDSQPDPVTKVEPQHRTRGSTDGAMGAR